MNLRRIFLSISLVFLLFSLFPLPASAQLGILPIAPACEEGEKKCVEKCRKAVQVLQGAQPEERPEAKAEGYKISEVLGCSIKYGLVKLWMFPFFITQLLKFLVALGGMLCMLFIVVGGYQYIAGGLTDEKEKGKKTMQYAITGFVVVLVSWIAINIVQTFLTK